MENLVKINCYTVLRCILLAGIVNVTAVEDNPSPDIRFAKQDSSATPDFQKHVIPLLGKLGCSSAKCHGSFQGAGGF